MGIYKIADVITKMEPRGNVLKQNALKYLCDDKSFDISVNVTEESIIANMKEHPEMDYNNWEYFLAGILFYKQLIQYDGMMLHASAVVVDGNAYLFTANPGVGKSTHTNLWLKLFGDKAYIINDDKPAIRKIDNQIFVYGTPFSGKNCIDVNKKAKLQGICFIEQDSENSIQRLDVKTAIPQILQQTLYSLPLKQMDMLLSLLDDILTKIPVYKLKCNISLDAARLSYNTMKP